MSVMSLEIHVDAYSGHRANERPQRFTADEEVHEIATIEDQWPSPEAMYFRVQTANGKHFILRYEDQTDQWTLQSGLDGTALLARPSIEVITVDPMSIREAESRIAGCERCRPEHAEIPFDWILADVLKKRGPVEFVLAETGHCPNCRATLWEKTLVEPQGGMEIETPV
jgi:hypothetical protein